MRAGKQPSPYWCSAETVSGLQNTSQRSSQTGRPCISLRQERSTSTSKNSPLLEMQHPVCNFINFRTSSSVLQWLSLLLFGSCGKRLILDSGNTTE